MNKEDTDGAASLALSATDADPPQTPTQPPNGKPPQQKQATLSHLAKRLGISIARTITLCTRMGYVRPNAATRIPIGAQENAIAFFNRQKK